MKAASAIGIGIAIVGLLGGAFMEGTSPASFIQPSAILINVSRGGVVDSRGSTLNAIQRAFDRAGVIFLDTGDSRNGGPGVRLKG